MNGKKMLSLAAGVVLLGSHAAAGPARAADKIVKIDGSSTVYPITEAAAGSAASVIGRPTTM